MKAMLEALQAFACASAARTFGQAPRVEILARIGLDEARWAALCGECETILSASPEARALFAIKYREARLALQHPVAHARAMPAPGNTEELRRRGAVHGRRDATVPLPLGAWLPPNDEGRTLELPPRPALPVLPFIHPARDLTG